MTTTLTKDFFFGGNATFTVDNGKGTHYTFKVSQPKKDNERFTGVKPHFAKLLTGPDNTSDYSYLGMVNPETGEVKLTTASRMTADSLPVKVLAWALGRVIKGGQLPEGYSIRHEGKCGCCGRALTVPESIERGIGPECWSKMGRA
jgi:hypothetical protein